MLTSFRKCMQTDEFIQWCITLCAGDTLLSVKHKNISKNEYVLIKKRHLQNLTTDCSQNVFLEILCSLKEK